MAEQLDITLVERRRCEIEKWQWMRSLRSVGPHYNMRHTVQISFHAISGLFQPRKGSSEVKTACSTILKLAENGLQHVYEKWVERCKKCTACQGTYFEKQTVTTPPQSSDSE
jgi:hypothetical protein